MSETTKLSQLQRLKAMQMNEAKSSSMNSFSNIVVVYTGIEPKPHFPKKLDSEGNKITEEKNGRKIDVRSEQSDGFTYTFAEASTCKKVQVVIKNKIAVETLGIYEVSGLGWDLKQSNFIFLEKDTTIKNF